MAGVGLSNVCNSLQMSCECVAGVSKFCDRIGCGMMARGTGGGDSVRCGAGGADIRAACGFELITSPAAILPFVGL